MPTLRAGSAAAGTGSSTSTTISLTVPSGTAVGDTICAWVACNTNGRTFSATGYSFSGASNPNSAAMSAGLLTKTAVSGDLGGSVTVTVSGAALAFAGVIFATPTAFDPATPDPGLISTSSNSAIGNNVTTTDNGDLLLMPAACRAGSAGGTPATITATSGNAISLSTVVSQLSTTSASVANIGIILFDGTQTSAGTVSNTTESATLSVSQANAGAFITLAGTATASGSGGSLLPLLGI